MPWWGWVIGVGALGILLATAGMFLGQSGHSDWSGLLLNVGTELLGAAVVYAVFEVGIVGRLRREARARELQTREEQQWRERFAGLLGSSVHDVAVAAAEELRRRGWLTDGSLQGSVLQQANLQGANLSGADLHEANLFGANLRGANLMVAELQEAVLQEVDLQEATLVEASLEGAELFDANLQGALLEDADLEGANLSSANLRGANLMEANLRGAILGEAKFNENTTLPDDTKWIPATDLARFTDPEHPDFWRSDEPGSAAYSPRGQEKDAE